MSVEEIINRMKTTAGAKTDKELADFLEAKPQTFSTWKVKNTIPLDTLIKFMNKFELSMDWLMFGKSAVQENTIDESMLLNAYKQMNQQQKMEALMFMSGLQQDSTSSTVQVGDNNSGVVVHNSKNVNVEN